MISAEKIRKLKAIAGFLPPGTLITDYKCIPAKPAELCSMAQEWSDRGDNTWWRILDNWLLSPEGQSVLMDKLEELNHCAIFHAPTKLWMLIQQAAFAERKYKYLDESTVTQLTIVGHGPAEARQEAVIKAALKMLGVEK